MTLIMLILAVSQKTPVFMWLFAMFCDTVLLSVYIIAHRKKS